MDGHIAKCYFCGNRWGWCACPPLPDDEDPIVPGFSWEGFWVTDPTCSPCGRFFVDPTVYYGEAYTQWPGREAYGSARVVTSAGV